MRQLIKFSHNGTTFESVWKVIETSAIERHGSLLYCIVLLRIVLIRVETRYFRETNTAPSSSKMIKLASLKHGRWDSRFDYRQTDHDKVKVKVKVNVDLYSASSRTHLWRSGMARVLKGSHSFTCTPRVHPLTEWTIPAFAFPAEAGTHLPTPEG